jgi:hypothetical protein
MQSPDVLGWALRLSLAGAFGIFGAEKLFGTSWVELFAQIGSGDWLRLLTGGMQLLGALLVVPPATARAGAALIALTMLGAVGAHLFILPTGLGGAMFPMAFFGFALAAGWRKPRHEHAPLSMREHLSPDPTEPVMRG